MTTTTITHTTSHNTKKLLRLRATQLLRATMPFHQQLAPAASQDNWDEPVTGGLAGTDEHDVDDAPKPENLSQVCSVYCSHGNTGSPLRSHQLKPLQPKSASMSPHQLHNSHENSSELQQVANFPLLLTQLIVLLMVF